MLAIFSSTNQSELTEKQRILTANATILYLLANLVNYLAFQGGTVVAASLSRIRHVLYPGHIEFKIADSQWRHNDVIFTYATGPLLCLGIGLVSVFLFFYFKDKGGLLKLLFLWMFLHGFNFFFGSLVAGTLGKGSFWYAVRWATFSSPLTYALAAGFGLVLLGIGILAAPAFLRSCDSLTLMEFQNRRKLLNAVLVVPWLLGSFFLVVLKFQFVQLNEALRQFAIDAGMYLTMLLMLIPAYLLALNNPYSETVEEPYKTHMAWGYFIIVFLMALAFRLTLNSGVSFP